MFKMMSLAIGALALAAFAGAGTGAYAQDQPSNPETNPSVSSPSGAQDQNGANMGRRGRRRNRGGDRMSGMGTTETPTPMVGNEMHIDWSRRYQLTPLEQKRLQAMGLSKEEVWAVAKAAHESNEDVDTVADMVLRGRTYWQIANELNIPYDSLFKWPQRWQSPEWADQVRAGSPVFIPRSAGMTGENGEMNRGGMGQRGEMMREENGGQASVQPASTATCPVCHMKLSTVQTAANSRAVVINGTTYYCCSGCDMSKATQ